MTILYSCVAYKRTVLVSSQDGYGNYENLVRDMLARIPDDADTKVTYTHEYHVHTLVDRGVVFICASEADFGKRLPYGFLTKIKDTFHREITHTQLNGAYEHSLDDQFKSALSNEMAKFSSSKGDDQLSGLQGQVDEVRGIMSKNIEHVLQRGERIEDLLDKTTDLESNAAAFQMTSRRVRRKYWWKNLKMKIILGIVVVVVLLIIILIILFSTGVLPVKSGTTTTTTAITTTTVTA